MFAAITLYTFISLPVLPLYAFFEDGSMNIQTEPTSIVWFNECTTDYECESLFE